ncbi:uncharacterized protein CTRU02_206396 [Colletotrichum truncatum]|uniref:Uncharacterized protein n=1 Tax=Colletotrichum truncatum TaxID=5467 RepID=A0ACC3Z6R8_COLTU|nr:uncharacterized protein CTRU02_09767 [Colletotrichum truncatum]KAF6787954.1 hypothetical protein CTRU02_09767 [Colletotrichum truncatum]
MDPASIIGVVAASLQFLEFGTKIATRAYQIKNSTTGQTKENATILETVNSLDKHVTHLEDRWREHTAKATPSQNEGELQDAVSECREIGSTMQDILHGLANNKSSKPFQSFQHAIQSVMARGDIEKLAARLEVARTRITMATVSCVLDEIHVTNASLAQIHKKADFLVQSRLREEIASDEDPSEDEKDDDPALARFPHAELLGIPAQIKTAWGSIDPDNPLLTALFDELVTKIWKPDWDANFDNHQRDLPSILEPSLDVIRQGIVASLQFHVIDKRENEIVQSAENTFEWIWHNEPPNVDGHPAWSSFPTWLRQDQTKVFWVTGVPGSGKSTLMKYILGHNELRTLLSELRPELPTVVLHYYAWHTGTNEQKSYEGLLRTILAQGLAAVPDIVGVAAKRRWALFRAIQPASLRDFEQLPRKLWELDELEEVLGCFLAELKARKQEIVIFIDGLDEFEAPPTAIVKKIQILGASGGIKICAASRPWREFEKAFDQGPLLRMHDLTKNDISAFIKQELEELQAFKDRQYEISELTEQIRTKARGVFLWVSLVVKQLRLGVDGGRSFAALQQSIDQLPERIQELYSVIWKRIPVAFKTDASKLFQLFKASERSRNMLFMWVAYEGKPASFMFGSKTMRGIKATTRRRLDSHTRGIIQLSHTDDLELLHRTAQEWMLAAWDEICSEAPLFNPHIHLMNAWLVFSWHWGPKSFNNALFHACRAALPAEARTRETISERDAVNDLINSFEAFEETTLQWGNQHYHWRPWLNELEIPNFVSLMGLVGASDYLRKLSQSGRLAKFINSTDSTERLELAWVILDSRLLNSKGEVPQTVLDSKFECVKLYFAGVDDPKALCGAVAAASAMAEGCLRLSGTQSRIDYYNKVIAYVKQWTRDQGLEKQFAAARKARRKLGLDDVPVNGSQAQELDSAEDQHSPYGVAFTAFSNPPTPKKSFLRNRMAKLRGRLSN